MTREQVHEVFLPKFPSNSGSSLSFLDPSFQKFQAFASVRLLARSSPSLLSLIGHLGSINMQFTAAAIALLIASANAATRTNYLEQDAICGDTKDCEAACRDGRYYVVKDNNNGFNFGCSQKANNEFFQGYDNPDCRFGTGDGKGELDQSRTVCDAVGGKLCPFLFGNGETVNYCVFVHEDAAKFKESCEANKGTVRVQNEDLPADIAFEDCK